MVSAATRSPLVIDDFLIKFSHERLDMAAELPLQSSDDCMGPSHDGNRRVTQPLAAPKRLGPKCSGAPYWLAPKALSSLYSGAVAQEC